MKHDKIVYFLINKHLSRAFYIKIQGPLHKNATQILLFVVYKSVFALSHDCRICTHILYYNYTKYIYMRDILAYHGG